MRQFSTRSIKMLFNGASLLAVVWFAAALAGCDPGAFNPGTGDDDAPGADAGPQGPLPDSGTPPPPPPPPPAEYKRGSLAPVYQLTPRNEYGRMQHKGIPMADGDFTSNETVTSASQKLDEIRDQVNSEHPDAPPVDFLKAEDRQRADLIPFRGNPSDVDHFQDVQTGINKLYVPLGGDMMTPGNEVAVVNLQDANNPVVTTRIRVGVHPQRIAVHPGGLIFVCNQFSNYISVIDPRTDVVLTQGGQPVEVESEYYCGDLLFAPVNPSNVDNEDLYLFVSNRYRHSLLQYRIKLQVDPLNNRPVGITTEKIAEILGVGQNPNRISLNESQDAVFVTSSNGGEVSRVNIASRTVTRRMFAGSPAMDIVNIADQVFMPTMMPDRGLLSRDEVQKPQQTLLAPIRMTGVDGNQHEVHPGAIFDSTRSYNFEDVRSGLLQVDFNLNGISTYYTAVVSSEPNFAAQQKVLSGAFGQAIARNAAGNRIFVAHGGSKKVQVLAVNTAIRPFSVTEIPGAEMITRERPVAISVDEAAQRVYVATWGGDVIEIFDLNNFQRIGNEIDLGYAQPAYPATNIERGEFFFYDASWSNNDDKTCAHCHVDNLIADGVGFSNGVTTPTAFHQVKPNYNLLTTDSYFWNGAFSDGDYTSVAFAAQIRNNCELIAFALIEGPSSNAAARVGDLNSKIRGNDANCRPQAAGADRLPQNFDQIQVEIAAQKQLANQVVEQETGFAAADVIRFIDFYSVAELRLPPNPIAQLHTWEELGADDAKVEKGKQLFQQAGCATCHDPANSRSPYADGKLHGAGADWAKRFEQQYKNDPQVLAIGGFPEKFLGATVSGSTPDQAINIVADPLDYFIPFCFDVTNCLEFADPLAVQGNVVEEARRLGLLIEINLGDPDRQFVPGMVRGAYSINTPSLRGVWTQAALLRHSYAHRIGEAILPPGHAALKPGEKGFAIGNAGNFDVHGAVKDMSVPDFEALELFVLSIQ